MAIKSVVVSSGHGSKVRGASGYLDEVNEARKVVARLAELFPQVGVAIKTFNDDISTTQDENLKRIVSYHNSQSRDLDISVHFNAYQTTSSPMGTECLYVTQQELSAKVASKIASAGQLKNRGAKYRSDLYFLNNTSRPAILIEVCFVDSRTDADLYKANFDAICAAITEAVSGQSVEPVPPEPVPPDPPDPGPDPEPPTPNRPTLAKGDKGPDVVYLQQQLNSDNNAGLDVDGDFGSRTDSAVRGYQASRNLDVDGIVGPQTWQALDMDAPPYVPPDMPPKLSEQDQNAIASIARNSAIANYSWRNRGRAPTGYVQGVALTFANAYRKLLVGHAPSVEAAKARSSNSKDVFNEYDNEFDNAGLETDTEGPEALISIYALLLGLGMRESSGKHCCGRDMSASNVTSDTCEAGAWQTSWNAHSCDSVQDQTFEEFRAGAGSDNPQGFLTFFKQGVSCSSSDWSCYGSGNGYQHQLMSKEQPAYAAEFATVTLRNLCNHYGPIIRHEAELRADAGRLFRAVKDYVDETTPSA